ncbi:MAG: stage II sporulation protein P [Clostridia bacterium]|nr:stage II sporulation protein P [Clostridia bacterium]
MFNIAVVNVKDLIKYLVGLVAVVLLLIWLTRYFSIDKNKTYNVENIELKSKIQSVLQNNYKEAINKIVPAIKELSQNEKEEVLEEKIASEHLFKKYLEVELANETVNPKNDNEENNKEESDVEVAQNENLEEAKTNIGTEVVTQNPIVANPTDIYGKVQIRNQTGYVLNEDILNPNIEVNASNIIIFHTHTCESYTPTEQNQYEASGTYRTIDLTHSVARVGDELTNYLSSYGYNVVHDKSFHDYPAYTGSYARSLKTVEALKQSNNADVIIDLHRDAIGSNSDYAPTIRIGEDYAAQLMFVIGTDGGGLWHPNWQQNLKFAVKVQQKAEELYPGLFKPIIVRNSRYNQHVSKAATIIEVGATGNTLEQCMSSMKYLSKVLNEVVK